MKTRLFAFGFLLVSAAFIGCGDGSHGTTSTPPATNFSLQVAPSTVTVVSGGEAQSLTVGATAVNGFTGTVSVQVGNLPAGITAKPMTLSLTPGTLQQIAISAAATASTGSASIALTGTSGTLTQNASASLTISAAPPAAAGASLSTTFFDFGNNLVSNILTKSVVTVTNTGAGDLTLNPALSGDASYSIGTGDSSCSTDLAAGSSCEMYLNYNPATASAPAQQNAVLNMGFGNVAAGTPQTVSITGTSAALPAGQVTATNNPQVALYTMTLPFPGSMTVNFGTDTNYGLKTWPQSTDTAGTVSIYVAGMKATTQYHMQASLQFTNGITVNDADHTFTTQAVPANMKIQLTTATTSGMTPQPGLELLNPLAGAPTGVIVTDLSGNTLWTYADPGNTTLNFIDGVKQLPDGNMLMVIGPSSEVPLHQTVSPAAITELREVNLAGDTVREIGLNDLNSELATASCAECNVTLVNFHHDVEVLPNGHMLLIANTIMALSPTSTPPLTNAPAQNVLGDVIVDLDPNMRPVWAWNEFNHLDPNRHPYLFADWTHTNAVIYSPDDGNILVSIRHQNWVVKVDYANGSGSGNILWRLGAGGDLTLKGGTDPTDWQYAQHGPSFFSKSTAGVFSLGLMDNGDDRTFPTGVTCGSAGAPPCLYSTIPVWQIDETAKTATFTFHQILPVNEYSSFGGNTQQLANNDVEYDLCGTTTGSIVYEVTQEATPQTVWQMNVMGTNLYRAFRIPSFYPGVQW